MAKCDYTYLTVNAEIAHPICQRRRVWARIRRAHFSGDHEPACHYPAYEGEISDPAHAEIGKAVLLLAPKRIVEIDVTKVFDNQVAFSLKNPSDASLITFLKRYIFVSRHEADSLDGAIDRPWRKSVFKATETISYLRDGYWIKGPNGQMPCSPEKITATRKSTWDHEHCMICMGCICEECGPEGYEDGNISWLCLKCYDKYIDPECFK